MIFSLLTATNEEVFIPGCGIGKPVFTILGSSPFWLSSSCPEVGLLLFSDDSNYFLVLTDAFISAPWLEKPAESLLLAFCYY